MNKIFVAVTTIIVAGGLYVALSGPEVEAQTAQFVKPDLSEIALAGEVAYNGSCAACHGVNLEGSANGPPFLHPVYVKGHHGDMAFILAVRNGTRAHHFRFGDMPPQPQITDEETGAIITYIREVQAANGF